MLDLLNDTNRNVLTQSEASNKKFSADEEQLVQLIYRFASKQDEWFNLLLSLSNCISIAGSFPTDHPYQEISGRVLSHLKNAMRISSRLSASAKYIDANSVLDHIPMGAGIIDRMGRIVEINQEARDQIEQSQNWEISSGYLGATHIDFARELDAHTNVESDYFSLAENVTPEGSKADQWIQFTTIPNQISPDDTSYYFCLPKRNTELIETNFLVQNYQLTETEALVVATLITEVSSKKIARKLKLKETTIRGHLSNIYLKVGVTRKTELIRKVLLHTLIKSHDLKQLPSSSSTMDTASKSTQMMYLRDGRRLSYLDHHVGPKGDKKYHAQENILVLHNVMGSAFEIPPGNEKVLRDQGIRIIIPERPGYGNSDRLENRNLEDFCHDIDELLNHLKIAKVKVMANSIGGAYALAFAEYFPHRIERIAMVNAVCRVEDMRNTQPIPILTLAVLQSIRYAPFLIEPVLKMAIGKSLEHFYEQQLNLIRPKKEGLAADINLLRSKTYRDYSLLNLKQSSKQGINIWSEEVRLCFSKWNFEVKNTETEYHFWHGEHDDVIHINAIEKLAKYVNTTQFNRLANETHFLFSRQFDRVVEQLIAPTQNQLTGKLSNF